MTARQQAYTGSLLDKAGCIDFIHINEYQGTGSVTHSSNLWIGGCSILDWWVLLFILTWQRKGAVSIWAVIRKSSRPGGLPKNISVSSGGWKSKMWGPVWFGSSEIPLLACRLLTSHCIFMWQKEGKRDFWGSFHKVINFIHEGSTHSWTNCLPKALLPKTITLGRGRGLGYWHFSCVGTRTFGLFVGGMITFLCFPDPPVLLEEIFLQLSFPFPSSC